jgi:outer membrane protein TolC
MRNKTKLITTICLVSLFSNIHAKEVSLQELIDIAVENNSNIKISKYAQEKEKSSHILSKTDYLPKVSLQGEFARYDIRSNGVKLDDNNVMGYTLSASQLLYDFGKTSNQIKTAKKNLEASNFQIVKDISSTILNTKQAYYNILNNYQQINLAKESIKIDELHLDQADNYFRAGVRTLIDVTDAKLQLSNSKLKLVQSKYSLKNSQTKLISILGSTNSKQIKIKEDAEIKTAIRGLKKNPLDLNKLIEKGLENRAEIKVYKKQIEAQQLQVKNSNNEYYPTLNLDASYSDKNSDEIPSIDSKQTTAGLYLKWNIYTGDSTKENIKISLVNLNTLRQQLFQQELQIKEDITISYFKVKENEESINIGILNIKLSANKLNLATQRYKAGLNDLVEVNDSKLAYTEAKSQLIDTYYSYLNSKAQLDYNLGILY